MRALVPVMIATHGLLHHFASCMQDMHTLMRIQDLLKGLQKACHGPGYINEPVAM